MKVTVLQAYPSVFFPVVVFLLAVLLVTLTAGKAITVSCTARQMTSPEETINGSTLPPMLCNRLKHF